MKKKRIIRKNAKNFFLKEENISLVLDAYDDIFSDFDPRPYNERSLSHDFIMECKRASADKPEKGIELRFLVPKKKRNSQKEAKIKKRLKEHFQKHFKEKSKFVSNLKLEGIIWFFIGVVLMFGSTFFYGKEEFLYKLLFIIFEPAGWFMLWEGLYKTLIRSKEETPDLKFYRKMSDAKIYFLNY